MSRFTKCETCKEYHFDDRKCKPLFLVSHEDYLGDHEKEIRGVDHEDAAENYARYYNEQSGDYPMMNGSAEIEVQVRAPHETVKRTFIITAEPSINYTTQEK